MIGLAGLQLHSSALIGIVYLFTSVALLFLLRQPLRQFEKPGSKGFFLAVIAISLWPLSSGINIFVGDLALSIAVWNIRLLAAGLVSIGWFLLAFEFTTRRIPSRPVLAGFAGYLVLTQLVSWTNSFHHLVLGPNTTVQSGVLLPEFGLWFWVQTVFNYGLILGATGLLATDWLHSQGLRRRQSALLTLSVGPPIVANLVTILDIVETVHDLTPFGMIGSGLILSWTLFRLELLNVVPIGRDIAVEVMEDAVVTVDETNRVVDCNAAAQQLFGIDEDYYGLPLREVLDSLPQTVFDRLSSSETEVDSETANVQTEVNFELDDQRRHLLVTRSPVVGTGDTRLGTVLVFRDITTLKRREEDLELVRQVLTRILRHNLRTKLTVIEGNAELLAEEFDDDRIAKIIEASASLNSIAGKAGHIERITKLDAPIVEYDLTRVVNDAVGAIEDRYPRVAITIDAPDSCPVQVLSGLRLVVDNLIENAANHNDSPDPTVRVTIDNDSSGPLLRVEDNGPAIPDDELEVLRARQETPLSHGSGIGLWLVKWWTDRADATLTFETDSVGTEVSIKFPESVLLDS